MNKTKIFLIQLIRQTTGTHLSQTELKIVQRDLSSFNYTKLVIQTQLEDQLPS